MLLHLLASGPVLPIDQSSSKNYLLLRVEFADCNRKITLRKLKSRTKARKLA